MPRKTNEGANTPNFDHFRAEPQYMEEIENLKWHYQSLTIVVNGDINLVGVSPQTTEIDALVYVWGEKILRLWQIHRCISETHNIGIQLLWTKVVWVLSNGDSVDDLECPLTPQMTYFGTFGLHFASLVRVKLYFKFSTLIDHTAKNRAWPGSRDPLKFWQKVAISRKR